MNTQIHKNPEVSIIILAHNNLAYTRLCLKSILAHTPGPAYELILVDNASDDRTPHYLDTFAREHENVILISSKANLGVAGGYNTAVAKSSGKYLVFIDNDTVVTEDWLTRLLMPLLDASAGMVAPVMNESKGKCRIEVDYEDLSHMPEFSEAYTTSHQGELSEVKTLALSCAAMRRQVFYEIGPFDEGFEFGMFVDEDYSLRLQQKGYRLLCAEDVFIHHWGSATLDLLDFQTYWQIFNQNRARFETKWNITWKPPLCRDKLLDRQLRQLVDDKATLASMIIERDQEIARLRGLLTDTYSSKGWKFLSALRKFRSVSLPRSTLDQDVAMIIGQEVHKGPSLTRILEEKVDARDIIIFLPSNYWNVPLFQRPHQLALSFARQGYLVFFCEPFDSKAFEPGFWKLTDRLYVIAQTPLGAFQHIPSPVAITVAYNTSDLTGLQNPRIVYEYIDELDVFPGQKAWLLRAHNEMLVEADLVTATSDRLYQAVKPLRPDTLLCPNAVDYAFIRDAIESTTEPPIDIQDLVQTGSPIIGYYGALAGWFDYELLRQAAEQRPEYMFLLIGPALDDTLKSSQITTIPNVIYLEPKPYAELPGYLKYFDVAIIPFLLNKITHATSPLKLFEYMSAGKPIVTTAIRECKKYAVVQTAENAPDFADKLDQALALAQDQAYLDNLRKTARENTWDQRVKQITQALEKSPSSTSK